MQLPLEKIGESWCYHRTVECAIGNPYYGQYEIFHFVRSDDVTVWLITVNHLCSECQRFVAIHRPLHQLLHRAEFGAVYELQILYPPRLCTGTTDFDFPTF